MPTGLGLFALLGAEKIEQTFQQMLGLHTPVILTLPYPPSANNRLVPGRRGGKSFLYLTQKVRNYYKEIDSIIYKNKMRNRFNDKLTVWIIMHPPDRRRRDIDNIKKVLYDSLDKAQLFKDDSQIICSHVYKKNPVKNGKLVLHLYEQR